MRAAFFHDHWFHRASDGTYYSGGSFPAAVWDRYLSQFDDIVVVGRVRPLPHAEAAQRLTLTSRSRVTIRGVEERSRIALLVGPSTRRHVRTVLDQVDAAIIRLPSLIGLTACREAIRLNKPWLAEVVACAWDGLWNHSSPLGKPSAPILFALNRHYIAKAPFAVYVSERFLQARYPCKGDVISCSNVVIGPPDEDVLARRVARIRAGVRGPLVLGLVGSLDVGFKGHESAIRALALLKRDIPAVRLRLLGPGDPARWQRLACSLGVEQHVEFCGTRASGQPVLEWMDELDLFVIPSLQEGLPRALIEAMSRGLPAVGARTGGIPELLAPSVLHRPRDHRRLAEIIRRLVGSPAELESCAVSNFKRSLAFERSVLDTRRRELLGRLVKVAESTIRPVDT